MRAQVHGGSNPSLSAMDRCQSQVYRAALLRQCGGTHPGFESQSIRQRIMMTYTFETHVVKERWYPVDPFLVYIQTAENEDDDWWSFGIRPDGLVTCWSNGSGHNPLPKNWTFAYAQTTRS